MDIEFEWDPVKEGANIRNHGVTFTEAATAFADLLSVTVPDPRHSIAEERYVLVGRSNRGRFLAVMHTDRDEIIRIISTRAVTSHERREYEEGE